VHELDGHRVTLDVYPAAGPLRGAAILSHGFTRSRRTLAGHAHALADAGVLTLTPDLPCTFDFRCNARALVALVGSLRGGEAFGAPVERVMLVGFSAGGLSSLLAAHTPGVVGYVGLDPFDRTLPDEAERLGLAAARSLRTEALLLRAPPSRCNAEAVAAPWAGALQGLPGSSPLAQSELLALRIQLGLKPVHDDSHRRLRAIALREAGCEAWQA
jgi:pimeloyl-ACP methyl ester carboxylesterase